MLTNIGSTGLRKDWTDNILWHHGAHLVDVGLWLLGAGDPAAAEARLTDLAAIVSEAHMRTGTPMEIAIQAATGGSQVLVCTASYHSTTRMFEVFTVTDRHGYELDILRESLAVGGLASTVASEQANNAQVARDFVDAVSDGRNPHCSGRSVLPAMRVLQRVQDHIASRKALAPS